MDALDFWGWLVSAVLVGMCIGMAFANRTRDSYIIGKADDRWRTAMCVRGRFFYLIPEGEYVQMSCRAAAWRLSGASNEDAREVLNKAEVPR